MNWYTKRGLLSCVYCSTGTECAHFIQLVFSSITTHPACSPALNDIKGGITLIGVHVCDVIAELFMVQDSSVDFTDTWSFMDRRLANVRESGHLTQQVGGD